MNRTEIGASSSEVDLVITITPAGRAPQTVKLSGQVVPEHTEPEWAEEPEEPSDDHA